MSSTRNIIVSEPSNRTCHNGVLEFDPLAGTPLMGQVLLDDGSVLSLMQSGRLPPGSATLEDLDGERASLCGRIRFVPERVLDVNFVRRIPRPQREQDLMLLLLLLLMQMLGGQITRDQLVSVGLGNVASLGVSDLAVLANRTGVDPRRRDVVEIVRQQLRDRPDLGDPRRVNLLASQVQRQQQRQSQRQSGRARQAQTQSQAQAQAQQQTLQALGNLIAMQSQAQQQAQTQTQVGGGRQTQSQAQAQAQQQTLQGLANLIAMQSQAQQQAQTQTQAGGGRQTQSQAQFQQQMQVIRRALRRSGLIL